MKRWNSQIIKKLKPNQYLEDESGLIWIYKNKKIFVSFWMDSQGTYFEEMDICMVEIFNLGKYKIKEIENEKKNI